MTDTAKTDTAKKKVKKTRTGVVIKDKMDKTVVVEVVRRVAHPLYGKYVRKRARFKAHDEKNECSVGDTVIVEESRPMSRDKRWRVTSIVKHVE
jgi:small subunit ribosomal protein S17